MTKNNHNYAQKIKDFRKEHSVTQEVACKGFGVSRVSLANWETSVNPPDLQTLINIARNADQPYADLAHELLGEVYGVQLFFIDAAMAGES